LHPVSFLEAIYEVVKNYRHMHGAFDPYHLVLDSLYSPMSTPTLILVFLLSLIAGGLIGAAIAISHTEIRHLKERLSAVEAKRHTHCTAAGIEDAMAVTLDLVRQISDVELQLSALKQRAGQEIEILGIVRQSPHSYDPDRPCGKRPDGRKGNHEQ
jgi:hypothetical protein